MMDKIITEQAKYIQRLEEESGGAGGIPFCGAAAGIAGEGGVRGWRQREGEEAEIEEQLGKMMERIETVEEAMRKMRIGNQKTKERLEEIQMDYEEIFELPDYVDLVGQETI